MKRLSLVFVLCLVSMMASCTKPTVTDKPDTTIPNEKPVIDYSRFQNPFGFSSLVITDRSGYKNDIEVVTNEIEFLDALMNEEVMIIKLMNDLSLGSKELSIKLEEVGKTLNDYKNVYRAHRNTPLTHPTLMESGIGEVRLLNRSDLVIYSESGIKIKHAAFLIEDSNNLVFRNIHFSELWEWDETSTGGYKRNDWDYFGLKNVNGIWFDHLTFDQAYDGIIDLREHSKNVTLSWSKLNFNPNDFISTQIYYLEENRSTHPYYDSLRNEGISKEDLELFMSFQKKGFNLGNTTDGEGFEDITMTFHHLEVFNLMDRMPRIRKGDAHLYHMILDNTRIHELRLKLNSPNLSFVNQGLVSTEEGSILLENSIYMFVSTPIKNHQDSNSDLKYTGAYQVTNSELITANRTYFGSSEDKNSLWVHNGSNYLPYHMRNYEAIPYKYLLEDIYYLKDTFKSFPTGAQTIETFDWLSINTNLSQ